MSKQLCLLYASVQWRLSSVKAHYGEQSVMSEPAVAIKTDRDGHRAPTLTHVLGVRHSDGGEPERS